MRKYLFLLAAICFCLFFSGCQTVKNAGVGVALVGKGIADDAYSVYKSVGKADKWFKDNCW